MVDNNIFIQNPNKRDRLCVFQDKLKRHLSNEYLYIVEKKDDLENQLVQLKIEQEQKNKTLFPNIEQKNVRKYFSPLNIIEIEKNKQDDKDKLITSQIERLKYDISQIDTNMHEIKEFLHDIDELLSIEEKEKLEAANIEEISDGDGLQDIVDKKDLSLEENVEGKDSYPQFDDKFPEIVDYFHKKDIIYPHILRNLYDYSDYLRENYDLEVLIEFNDNNIETSVDMNRNFLMQLDYNVNAVLQDYDISTILIMGEVTAKRIQLSLNYVCDQEDIEAMNVVYEVKKI